MLSPILLLLGLLLLCGCGNKADTSGLAGTYILFRAEEDGVVLSEEQASALALSLRLDPGGRGVLTGGDEEGRLRWSVSGDTVSIRTGTVLLYGTFDGSSLNLRTDSGAQILCFRPQRTSVPETDEAETAEDTAEVFVQDWYGWWKLEDSSGRMPVSWYDCCAELLPQTDGTIRLRLWDEDGSRAEPLSEVFFVPDEEGTLRSLNGYLLYERVEENSWVLPHPEQIIRLDRFPHNAQGVHFSCSFYLRPWGQRWDDLSAQQRPFYYDDWYLPLLKGRQPMPDSIPWEELEEARSVYPSRDD